MKFKALHDTVSQINKQCMIKSVLNHGKHKGKDV
jgi:hypothetical protein